MVVVVVVYVPHDSSTEFPSLSRPSHPSLSRPSCYSVNNVITCYVTYIIVLCISLSSNNPNFITLRDD